MAFTRAPFGYKLWPGILASRMKNERQRLEFKSVMMFFLWAVFYIDLKLEGGSKGNFLLKI